ncbi:hypothetical protein Agub_g6038, partial [Astrephomene gubernaculifera]
FRCGLPVEVAWQGSGEMDAATWASLERHFAPLRGINVRDTPHPVRGLHGERFDATSYSGKVYALAVSRFREVLMLDADSLPLLDPAALFDDPRFVQYGSLFWPDAWTGLADRAVFGMYGMNGDRAESVLRLGRGAGRRDSESGQLLLDRSRHLDVLEALLLLNRHPDANKPLLWGDKDSFWLAFAAVGKAHCFGQVAVPPAAFLHWSPDKLLTKATRTAGPGWLLAGFVQNIEDVPYVYGSMVNGTTTPVPAAAAPPGRPVRPGESLLVPLTGLVRPAFLHRTIDKLRQEHEPRVVEVVTAPMAQRWANFFLDHDNPGPTRGVPWDYCVPDSSLRILSVTPLNASSSLGNAATSTSSSGHLPRSRLRWNVSAPAQLPPTTDQWLAKARREWRQRAAAAGGRRRRGSKEDAKGLVWSWGDEEVATEVLGGAKKEKVAVGRSGSAGGSGDPEGMCPLVPSTVSAAAKEEAGGCPVEEMEVYLQALDAGVPLDRHPALERLCAQQLKRAAGAAGQRAEVAAETAAKRRDLGLATSATRAYRAAKADGSAKWVPLPRSSVGPYAYLDTPDARGGDVGALGSWTPPPLPALRQDW